MKNKAILLLITVCLLAAGAFTDLLAQSAPTLGEQSSINRRIGSAAATELLIPVGARITAMGGAGMAISTGVEAVHWNPAGLARINYGAEAMVSTMAYIADIRMNYAAVGLKFGGFGVVGLNVRALDVGDIIMTTNDDPYGDGGRTYSPNFITVGLTYARWFTDAISFGATFKVISEKIVRATGTGYAVDLGVQYHGVAGIKGLDLGVALKNYGPQMKFGGSALLRKAKVTEGRRPEQYFRIEAQGFELPSQMEIGVSYEMNLMENAGFLANGSFVNDNLALNSYRAGGEFWYEMGNIKLFARGGYEYAPGNDIDEYLFGASGGFGAFLATPAFDITIDYAWRQTQYFSDNSVFSIKFGF